MSYYHKAVRNLPCHFCPNKILKGGWYLIDFDVRLPIHRSCLREKIDGVESTKEAYLDKLDQINGIIRKRKEKIDG